MQRAIVTVLCHALEHSASTLLSDVSVTVSAGLERICDIAREQLEPAVSSVTTLLSSTSADLTHAFKGLSRLLSVNIDQKVFIQDPASILLELLPLCCSVEFAAAALNVMHAIQVRKTEYYMRIIAANNVYFAGAPDIRRVILRRQLISSQRGQRVG